MTPSQTTQLTQDAQTIFYIVSAVVAIAITVFVKPWIQSHQAQVDAATKSITDASLRDAAQAVVRWLESDPAMAQLPGLVQRAHGIQFLTQRTGLPETTLAPVLDAAYNALTATGQVAIAPKVPPPAALAAPTLSDLAAAVLAQLQPPPASASVSVPTFAVAPVVTPPPTPPPTTQPSPAVATPVASLAPTEPVT